VVSAGSAGSAERERVRVRGRGVGERPPRSGPQHAKILHRETVRGRSAVGSVSVGVVTEGVKE
jgi:hypothetical protein